MHKPMKYRSLPAQQEMLTDETDTIVVGFELRISLTAHGRMITEEAIFALPEADRFPYAKGISDMTFFAEQVTKAQLAIDLPTKAVATMDALLAANGIEVPADPLAMPAT